MRLRRLGSATTDDMIHECSNVAEFLLQGKTPEKCALQCIEQSTRDVFLSYELMKISGTPFASKNLILHKKMGRASGDLLHI